VYSVETNKHIFKLFHHRVAASFKFFHTKRKRHGNIQAGTPRLNEIKKNLDFRPISGFGMMGSMTGRLSSTVSTE